MLDGSALLIRAGGRDVGALGTRLRQLNIWEVIAASTLHHRARVDAEEEHEPKNDQNPDNADATATSSTTAGKAHASAAGKRKTEAAAFFATVFNILAFSETSPAHICLPAVGSLSCTAYYCVAFIC